MRNVEKLKIFNECFSTSEPPPDHVASWFKKALNDWENGKALADAFNIYDSAAERMIRRNNLIFEFRQLHPALTTWSVSKLISEQIKNNKLSPILKRANCIYSLPVSTRQIYNLLKSNGL